MTDTTTIPTLDRVTTIRLAISVEVWPDLPGDRDNPPDPADVHAAIDRARRTVRDYLAPLRAAINDDRTEAIDDAADDVVRSDYDPDVLCVHGSAHVDLTPDEWLAAADDWCIDIAWIDDPEHGAHRTTDRTRIPALPPGRIVPTLGILGPEGVTPAVAIDEMDHGWGHGGYEPTVVSSFYVGIAEAHA